MIIVIFEVWFVLSLLQKYGSPTYMPISLMLSDFTAQLRAFSELQHYFKYSTKLRTNLSGPLCYPFLFCLKQSDFV